FIEEDEEIEFNSLKEEMERYEKEIIMKVYKSNKSYRSSAKTLGISHTAVMKKVKKYNIKEDDL
ncbi:AAA family ATPase, partial [Paraclostridium benzoelyticum]|nr:AAA family ATPase [Paraclostridium benzoelyticum]